MRRLSRTAWPTLIVPARNCGRRGAIRRGRARPGGRADHFERTFQRVEIAHPVGGGARPAARGTPDALVADALVRALESAESCRRHVLVGEIEAELRRVDEAAHIRHVYRRVRGRGIREETVALLPRRRRSR